MSQSNCFSEEITRIKLSASLASENEVEDLKEIGMQDVTLDDNCYIMATLPSNIKPLNDISAIQ